jgi:DNA modification methylase
MYKVNEIKNSILVGDVLVQIKLLPSASIDCVITSPPYWQLRDYGFKAQWGLENSFTEYLDRLWKLMDEVWRVLKPNGTVWINLGDTYFGSGNGKNSGTDLKYRSNTAKPKTPNRHQSNDNQRLEKKSLSLIPHRFVIGCLDRGWLIRNDIIWAKPNSLPESTKDRFSKKHEHVFFMTKSKHYYFDLDAIRDAYKASSLARVKYKATALNGGIKNKYNSNSISTSRANYKKGKAIEHKMMALNTKGKNPGDVTDFWVISNKGTKQNHFAAFNTELIRKPILAGCPKGGIILDPFCGIGTTGMEALRLDRYFIGIEAKKEFSDIAKRNMASISNTSRLSYKNSNYKNLNLQLQALNF